MPLANRFTIHILSAVAEYEARLISQRTKAAFAAAKARGRKFGNPNPTTHRFSDAARNAQVRAVREKAKTRALDYLPLLCELRDRGETVHGIALQLTEMRIETPRGRAVWRDRMVARLFEYAGEPKPKPRAVRRTKEVRRSMHLDLPTMPVRFKSTEQQDLQSLHRARERVVCARTALINHMRGLLGEYGVILAQGAWRFLTQAADAIAIAELSDLTRELFDDLLEELRALDLRLDKLDRQLLGICRTNEACKRLSKLPGVGPVIATALVAAVDDGHHFRSGRELAAWIGLVPRQYTTGGKPRLGGIGRRANHYLRRQMIHGARAVMFRLAKHDDRRSQWLKGLAARRGFNRAIVALANKTARIAWAVLTRKEDYLAAA